MQALGLHSRAIAHRWMEDWMLVASDEATADSVTVQHDLLALQQLQVSTELA